MSLDGPGEMDRTMLVDTRQLKRPTKPYRPFSFASRLEKVPAGESRLTSRLQWLAPGGEAVSPLNIPAWRGFPLRSRLAALTGLTTDPDRAVALTAMAVLRGRGGPAGP